ncbi:MAG: cation diffusion facilitator family transporter [Proteobacteria bacterium]|nr:cation diffusion facilitator family transporter [Pseudomonadota bacterium]
MVDTHPVSLTIEPTAAARLMRQASLASMSVATILIFAKGVAWLITDSVGMLSSLIDSALDLVSSLITFVAIRQALIPADEDHRFGHGKAEALAGVAQAGFIAASAGGLVLTVADRFLHPRPVQQEFAGVLVSGLAIALTVALMLFQSHVVRRTNSIAIGADKAHYTTDFVTNIAVGVGILASSRLGQPLIDLAVAMGVAIYLVTNAWAIGRISIDVLMDRELPPRDRQRILDIVQRQPGVRSVHDLRTRSSGLTQFIQLHVVLHPNMSLGRAHVIGDTIQAAIEEAYPQAEVILHIDPRDDSADPQAAGS